MRPSEAPWSGHSGSGHRGGRSVRRTRRGTTRVARAPSREVALGEGRQLEQTWLAARPPCLPCKSGGHFIGVSPLRRRLRASPHGPSRVLGGEANGDVV